MIRDSRAHTISSLYTTNENAIYKIPRFQREYTWKQEECDDLFDDLSLNPEGYFIGTIICVPRDRDGEVLAPTLELIDGQQRMVTISLLYCAVYEKLVAENNNDRNFITITTNLMHKLVLQPPPIQMGNLERDAQPAPLGNPRLELSSQAMNNDDYLAILSKVGLGNPGFRAPAYLGNRRIMKTFQRFKSKLADSQLSDILALLEKINKAVVVKIEVTNSSSAFKLFESLNNRGIPLTAMDLIKNKFLSEMPHHQIDHHADRWNSFVSNLSIDDATDYSIQERFLKHFYNAFKHLPEIGLRGYDQANRSNLIEIYERLLSPTDVALNTFSEMNAKSEIYNLFIKPPGDRAYSSSLVDMQRANSLVGLSFLLYLFSKKPDDHALLNNVAALLVKYFIRRHLTDEPSTKKLDKLFIDLITHCIQNDADVTVQRIANFLRQENNLASTQLFKEKLTGNIYDANAEATRFILCKIEETYRPPDQRTDLWEKAKKGYLFTIEHIFPEGETIPQVWVDEIGNGTRQSAINIQRTHVHNLGNLTLTAFNSNLGNASFLVKRDRTDSNGRNIGYKNGMYLNSQLANMQNWRLPDIKRRTKRLAQLAWDIFRFPHEPEQLFPRRPQGDN